MLAFTGAPYDMTSAFSGVTAQIFASGDELAWVIALMLVLMWLLWFLKEIIVHV